MQIKLLATDLDGTLFGSSGELALYDEFRKRLTTLREKYDMQWVICTGRSLRSFMHLFSPMKTMGLMPDYVIVNHAYIYHLKRNKYKSHYYWNLLIHYHLWASKLYMKDAIKSWYKQVMDMTDKVTTVYHRNNRLCLRFDNEDDAEGVAKLLLEKSREFKHLRVFRFMREVDVRMVPFTKGLALEELANRLGITSSNILAIGNGHNDISILDGVVAKYMGCPENAETDVMAVVNHNKGHISSRKFLGGVIDVIDAYLENKVNSDLPEWWVANKKKKNPLSQKRQMNHPPKAKMADRRKVVTITTIIMIVYCVLLVFANSGIIPFANIIRMPIVWLMDLFVKILEFI